MSKGCDPRKSTVTQTNGCLLDKCKSESDKCGFEDYSGGMEALQTWVTSMAIFSVPVNGQCQWGRDGNKDVSLLTACQYLGLHKYAYDLGCKLKYPAPATETSDYDEYLNCLAGFFGQAWAFEGIKNTTAYTKWAGQSFPMSKDCEQGPQTDGCLLDKCKGESDKCGFEDYSGGMEALQTWVTSMIIIAG